MIQISTKLDAQKIEVDNYGVSADGTQWYVRRQAAERAGISIETLRNYMRKGLYKCKYYEVRGSIIVGLWNDAEIEKVIEIRRTRVPGRPVTKKD